MNVHVLPFQVKDYLNNYLCRDFSHGWLGWVRHNGGHKHSSVVGKWAKYKWFGWTVNKVTSEWITFIHSLVNTIADVLSIIYTYIFCSFVQSIIINNFPRDIHAMLTTEQLKLLCKYIYIDLCIYSYDDNNNNNNNNIEYSVDF